jgi:hypothetical protein
MIPVPIPPAYIVEAVLQPTGLMVYSRSCEYYVRHSLDKLYGHFVPLGSFAKRCKGKQGTCGTTMYVGMRRCPECQMKYTLEDFEASIAPEILQEEEQMEALEEEAEASAVERLAKEINVPLIPVEPVKKEWTERKVKTEASYVREKAEHVDKSCITGIPDPTTGARIKYPGGYHERFEKDGEFAKSQVEIGRDINFVDDARRLLPQGVHANVLMRSAEVRAFFG